MLLLLPTIINNKIRLQMLGSKITEAPEEIGEEALTDLMDSTMTVHPEATMINLVQAVSIPTISTATMVEVITERATSHPEVEVTEDSEETEAEVTTAEEEAEEASKIEIAHLLHSTENAEEASEVEEETEETSEVVKTVEVTGEASMEAEEDPEEVEWEEVLTDSKMITSQNGAKILQMMAIQKEPGELHNKLNKNLKKAMNGKL